jgi:hypothetical protein
VVAGKLWLGFAGTDVSANYHFSDWFEMDRQDEQLVVDFDVDQPVKDNNQYNSKPNSEIVAYTSFDAAVHVDAGWNPFVSTQNGFISDYFSSEQEMYDAMMVGNEDGTGRPVEFRQVTVGRGTKWVVSFITPLPYTKLTIKDHPAMTTSLSGFGGSNLAYIAMIESPTIPTPTGEGIKIFGTGSQVDLSCKSCGDTLGTDVPYLKVVDSTLNKTHSYIGSIYKSGNTCPGANKASWDAGSNWYEAPMVFYTGNAGAPLIANQFSEMFFDLANGDKLKLQDLGC